MSGVASLKCAGGSSTSQRVLISEMGKPNIEGTCHLCGQVGKLSFEHVPPEAAFNDHRLLAHRVDQLLKDGSGKTGGKFYQRGAGAYTLCKSCNEQTGGWYGRKYVEWVRQGMFILQTTQREPSLWYNFHIFPLRIIKQIACMFFSINSENFQEVHPELVRFVLNPTVRHLPESLRIFAFYAVDLNSRQSSVTASMNLVDSSKNRTFTEMTFLPFGYCLTFDGEPPPHESMADISSFGRYSYNDWKTIPLQMPVLPTVSFLPGDYRSKKEIDRTIAETGDLMHNQPLHLFNSERQTRFGPR